MLPGLRGGCESFFDLSVLLNPSALICLIPSFNLINRGAVTEASGC